MTHSLVLEVPDSIYLKIVKEAESKKRKVEEIALERLANDEPREIEDPLDKFVGAFRSDVPDWADNHDKYLGEELAKDLNVKR